MGRYVDMGGWVGGQAEYLMVPYADFNLLRFPDRDRAMDKIRDLTRPSDIFPTGFHGALSAGVGPGSVVYVAGAGPVGLACAAKLGNLSIRIGLGWAKSHVFVTGQCRVMRYHRHPMMSVLHGKVQIAKAVNVEVIPLGEAPRRYKDFDQGAAKKFVLDPHGLVGTAS